jgi:hypothetical protein
MTDTLDIQSAAPSEAATVPEVETAAKETPESEAEQSPDDAKPEDEMVVFPKKAINALAHRDRKIGKLKAETAALRAELDQFRSSQATNQKTPNTQQAAANNGPQEDDFDSYGDYLIARAKFELKQEQQGETSKRQAEQVSAQKAQWAAEREQTIASKVVDYKKTVPDFESVVNEAADIADDFPEYIVDAFYEADDGALAFYNLAKQGKLEALASMSPTRAAMEIAKAQGSLPVFQQNQTNTLRPMAPARGTGVTSKPLSDLSEAELLKRWKL